MPDDPSAFAELEKAVAGITHVFRKCKGQSNWGDALPHHPHQKAGMTWSEIESLANRPALLPVSALDMDEVDYFFAHSGYSGDPQCEVPPALRYFLPRLAAHFAQPAPEALGVMLDPEPFGRRLAISRWASWPSHWREPIEAFLAAWANAACRWMPDDLQSTCFYRPENRDPAAVLRAVMVGGLSEKQVCSILNSLRGAAMTFTADSLSTSAERLYLENVPQEINQLLADWLRSTETLQALLAEACQDVPWRAMAGQVFDRLG